MTFQHVKHDFPTLVREESETGERLYLTPDGKKYPSVTTVIADHNKEAIDKWRLRVGHDKAKRISENASSRGDIVHLALEAYLNNHSTAEIVKKMLPNAKAVYVNMKAQVERRLSVVHGLEQPLISHKLRMAGTTDCIAVYDNLLSIVDFKTSLRLKKKEWVHGYFMQLTAYAFMFQEMTGLKIEQGVILIGVDGESEAQTFNLPRTEFDPYFKNLVSWRDKYEQREAA